MLIMIRDEIRSSRPRTGTAMLSFPVGISSQTSEANRSNIRPKTTHVVR